MVCIPCIVIPFVLWVFHRFLRPYVSWIWEPFFNKKGDAAVTTGSAGDGKMTTDTANEKVI
jgi:hypothetical protein